MALLNGRTNEITPNDYGLSRNGQAAISQAELLRTKRALMEMEQALQASRQDAARLRKALRLNGRAAGIADQAYRDARLMAAALFNDEDVSRITMRVNHNMTRRRWEWARALMRMAELTDSYYRLRVWNPLTVESALLDARDKAADDLARLKRYLPLARLRELS